MKAKYLLLGAVILEALFLIYFLFTAPEPHGFLKAVVRDLEEPRIAAALASEPELKISIDHHVTGALTSNAFLLRLTLIVTATTLITSTSVLVLNRPHPPQAPNLNT